MAHINTSNPQKPWDGRFSQPTDQFVEQFTASIQFDQRLAPYDIQGSIAHASMLAKVGVLTSAEADAIITGLQQILTEVVENKFQWQESLEDVHMNIEARLTDLVGPVGKKLHTARSRNDQVATDIRLYLRTETDQILASLTQLQQVLALRAEQEAHTIMPGFTHLQPAQPVTFGHHLLAWAAMLQRDYERFIDGRKRLNSLPLGAAALAGTPYPLDREYTAQLLGFERICDNSLDAVSDRDFAIEFTSTASLLMIHLSRISEELIFWASAQFQFIHLPDQFCTGSSIMPQKKNPDVPELIRGKSGRVIGHLMGLLMLMKSQPLAYNKDNQEDKEPLFDTVDTIKNCLRAYIDLMPAMIAQPENMRQSAQKGLITATDLADYLVRKGLPFRDCHHIVGKTVGYAIEQQKDLSELSLAELQKFCAQIDSDVFAILTLEGSVKARNHLGGTAPEQVKAAAQRLKDNLAKR